MAGPHSTMPSAMRLAMLSALAVTLAVVLSGALPFVAAQATTPQPGDPPVAALISISPADENGIVTITGAAGAVFPAAQVAVRNLFTEQTVYVNAGIQGGFTAQIFGPGSTPFHISPAQNIPGALRDRPGSLPGGPGTIVYGTQPEARTEAAPVTQILLDGDLGDWAAYSAAVERGAVQALLNLDSLYIGYEAALPEGALVVVEATFNNVTYAISFDPRLPQAAVLREIAPFERDLGTLAVASALNEDGDVIEARLPVESLFSGELFEAALVSVSTRTDGDEVLASTAVDAALNRVEEVDGIVYPGGRTLDGMTRFAVAGPLAQGAGLWVAAGRVDALEAAPGDSITLEMDFTLDAPDFPESLVGLSLRGALSLQPVAVDRDGDGIAEQNVAAEGANNGWSNLLTRSGLARDNVTGDLFWGEVVVPAGQVVRREGRLLAGMRFTLTLPDDLPPGYYVPVFRGFGQVGDGDAFRWREAGVFGMGPGISGADFTRLPLVFDVGGMEAGSQPWALFMEQPADGARGLLPEEAAGRIALSTRVQHNPPTYILPPGAYPVEPYIPNQLTNSAGTILAPLVPTLFPGGRLNASVERPDGSSDDLPSAAVVQNVVSTAALDETEVYGARNLLDIYRLTTLNPALSAYAFDAYGPYTITLTGNVEDIRGNRYEGGGTYRLLIAEPLDLLPGVLPGTPFEVGDRFHAGVRLLPGVPAEVIVTLTVYPLDGGEPVTWESAGTANAQGHFIPDPAAAFRFDIDGEYVVDYEARYTGAEGVLWAASLRAAGVIATPGTDLIAHGQRGVPGYDAYRPAWFDTSVYPPGEAEADDSALYFPYFGGDIVTVADGGRQAVAPVLQVQDTGGAYASWLRGTIPDYTRDNGGDGIDRLAVEGSLPLLPVLGGPPTPFGPALVPDFIANDAYSYVSAVRPGVSARQFVIGDAGGGLDLAWDSDDRYNGQIGAGIDGDRPGDATFLFGGTVVRNAEAGVNDAAIYAALAVTLPAEASGGVYPPYRGAAGGADGGPLFTLRGVEYAAMLVPTGVHPGQVYTVGETLVLAGQVGPTLPATVTATITAPDGTQTNITTATNAIGHFFAPDDALTLDQPGVWSVRLTAVPAGSSSAGTPEEPLPVATVPGLPDGRFEVFVLPPGSEPLPYNDGDGDVDTSVNPGVPFNFSETVPAGWEEATAYRVVSIPGYVLEAGALPLTGRSAIYTYSPAQLARDFPMLEFEGDGDGPAASDVVTLTFTITGTDEAGNFVIRSRVFHIFHDRLLSLASGS